MTSGKKLFLRFLKEKGLSSYCDTLKLSKARCEPESYITCCKFRKSVRKKNVIDEWWEITKLLGEDIRCKAYKRFLNSLDSDMTDALNKFLSDKEMTIDEFVHTSYESHRFLQFPITSSIMGQTKLDSKDIVRCYDIDYMWERIRRIEMKKLSFDKYQEKGE